MRLKRLVSFSKDEASLEMWIFDWHPDEFDNFEARDRFDLLIQQRNETGVDRNLEEQMASREIWMLLAGHIPFIPSAYKPD